MIDDQGKIERVNELDFSLMINTLFMVVVSGAFIFFILKVFENEKKHLLKEKS